MAVILGDHTERQQNEKQLTVKALKAAMQYLDNFTEQEIYGLCKPELSRYRRLIREIVDPKTPPEKQHVSSRECNSKIDLTGTARFNLPETLGQLEDYFTKSVDKLIEEGAFGVEFNKKEQFLKSYHAVFADTEIQAQMRKGVKEAMEVARKEMGIGASRSS